LDYTEFTGLEKFIATNPAPFPPPGRMDNRAKSQAFEVPIGETMICQKKKL
jgi:hypothetical protein